MANKYFFDGIDISTLTNSTSTIDNTLITDQFGGFPGVVIDEPRLTSAPSNFTSNDGAFNSNTHKPSYFCYNSDEEYETPPFFITNNENVAENLFVKNYSTTGYKKIRVKNDEFTSGTGTVLIPDWCNAIKMYFISKNGSPGAEGMDLGPINAKGAKVVNGTTVNQHRGATGFEPENDYDVNYHNHNQTGNSNDWDRHDNNTRHHQHNMTDSTARFGGEAGAKGLSCMGWFSKYIKITAGATNTLDYAVSTNTSGTSTVALKEAGSTIANYEFKNATNGTNGSAAYWTPQNTHTHIPDNNHEFIWHGNYNADRRHKLHTFRENRRWTTASATANGTDGTDGTDGTLTMGTLSGDAKYMAYNVTPSYESKLIIYYFKYQQQ